MPTDDRDNNNNNANQPKVPKEWARFASFIGSVAGAFAGGFISKALGASVLVSFLAGFVSGLVGALVSALLVWLYFVGCRSESSENDVEQQRRQPYQEEGVDRELYRMPSTASQIQSQPRSGSSSTLGEGIARVEGNCIHGRGTCYYSSGDVYSGTFKVGKPDGYGTYRSADGSTKYEGFFRQGFRHGKGKLTRNGVCVDVAYANGFLIQDDNGSDNKLSTSSAAVADAESQPDDNRKPSVCSINNGWQRLSVTPSIASDVDEQPLNVPSGSHAHEAGATTTATVVTSSRQLPLVSFISGPDPDTGK